MEMEIPNVSVFSACYVDIEGGSCCKRLFDCPAVKGVAAWRFFVVSVCFYKNPFIFAMVSMCHLQGGPRQSPGELWGMISP